MTLPPLVRRYVERAVSPGDDVPGRVRLEQSGEMWQKPGGPALRFTAVEELAVGEVAFSWRARFRVARLLALRVHDWYRAGEGALEGRILALPVLRSRGPEVTKGEAMRYLAELPWVPHAMAANPELEWRELDDATVEVAAAVASPRPAVRLHFDPAGDVDATTADDRPRAAGKGAVDTPFRGEFGDYRMLGGVRVPTAAEVAWKLSEGWFTYFRGRVTGLERLD
jgi:hypothetical protein